MHRVKEPVQETRIKDDIESLKQQIADQEHISKDPEAAQERVEKGISTGRERERQPEKPKTGASRTKFINSPPSIAPTYFQDRHVETKIVGDFLKNEVERLMTVVGRAGIGKTTMVCRLLKFLEGGRLPENGKIDSRYLNEGKQAYPEARKINNDPGYVKRELRLFDELAKMDEEGMLKDLRTVVSGE